MIKTAKYLILDLNVKHRRSNLRILRAYFISLSIYIVFIFCVIFTLFQIIFLIF